MLLEGWCCCPMLPRSPQNSGNRNQFLQLDFLLLPLPLPLQQAAATTITTTTTTTSTTTQEIMPFNSRVTVLGFVLTPCFSGTTAVISIRPSSPSHLLSPFLGIHLRPTRHHSSRCDAKTPRPPSPEPDSPFGKDMVPIPGLESTVSKFQDRAQIFIAVLFWMSLFFWACASDSRNDGGPTKGSGFRR